MHTLLSTSATKQTVLGNHNLIPLSPYVLNLIYGSADYVRSVFGTTDITRQDIDQYYQGAKHQWSPIEINKIELHRPAIGSWLRESNIAGLDFYFPIGYDCIWFKREQDAFMFRLKFGAL